MDGVTLTRLSQFVDERGAVYHALKASEPDYVGFGEIYYSIVHKGIVKGWKRHNKMTMNLTVPIGSIKIVAYDGRQFMDYVLGPQNYCRLTVRSGIWVAFKGISETNLIANVANLEYDPTEFSTKKLKEIDYDWS
jgi:dTDP-4-dehydrorhamnose 3,5-epimerase